MNEKKNEKMPKGSNGKAEKHKMGDAGGETSEKERGR